MSESNVEIVPDRPEKTARSRESDKKEEPPASSTPKSVYIETDVVEDEVLYASLQKLHYYHGFLPREDLALILNNDGDYLIRVSEVVVRANGPGDSGIKRDIILSVCVSDGSDHNSKDVKSEHGGRKMRNLVIRRYDGKVGIKTGCMFDTIEALLANHHVSNKNESRDMRILKTPCSLQSWEYRHSAVKLGEKLGEGAYGEVRKGMLQRKGKSYPVAVKLTKGNVSDMNKLKIREMMKEARLMRYFKHPNVVRFYGVAVVEQPLYIFLELVNGGALNTYLQKHKSAIKLPELMNMCYGAARGLQYLHANQCIHRDIAARNCLYSADKVTKLSDFGLSLIGKQYKLGSAQKLPIKWLAPETITTMLFTHKTDVYSYGVMCFEIFAEGNEPWDGITNTEAKRNVVQGRHLQLSGTSPDTFRSFVHEKVFVVDPMRRVVMNDVVRFIEPIITDLKAGNLVETAAAVVEKSARIQQSVMMPLIPEVPPVKPKENSTRSKSRDKKKAAVVPPKQPTKLAKK